MGKLNRRQFLGQASCAAVGATTLLSSLASLRVTNKLLSTQLTPMDDYKALVCILLAGGNDSYNMLVPFGQTEYDEYAATRSNLALARETIRPLSQQSPIGKDLGIHPSFGSLQAVPGFENTTRIEDLYQSQKLAFIANVGTLIEPLQNYQEFENGMKRLPLGIYSHSDQIEQWQTALPQSRSSIGWGGRMADLLQEGDTQTSISMNISLAGRNVFQSGQTVLEYSISNQGDGVEGIKSFPGWWNNAGFLEQIREDAVKDMAAQMYANVFQDTYGSLTDSSLETIEAFQEAIQNVGSFQTAFSEEALSQDLQMIARTIAANQAIGTKRQTFFTTFGGWDHHDEVMNNQMYMLGVVSAAVGEFMSALEEVNLQDKVGLFIISDFARTLTSNGNGSDHAWGGNVFVAGGEVKGGQVYGSYPDTYIMGNPLMVSPRGNFIPTIASDLYFAELALWFGISPHDLHLVLPNIGNFYDVNSGQPPIGFIL